MSDYAYDEVMKSNFPFGTEADAGYQDIYRPGRRTFTQQNQGGTSEESKTGKRHVSNVSAQLRNPILEGDEKIQSPGSKRILRPQKAHDYNIITNVGGMQEVLPPIPHYEPKNFTDHFTGYNDPPPVAPKRKKGAGKKYPRRLEKIEASDNPPVKPIVHEKSKVDVNGKKTGEARKVNTENQLLYRKLRDQARATTTLFA